MKHFDEIFEEHYCCKCHKEMRRNDNFSKLNNKSNIPDLIKLYKESEEQEKELIICKDCEEKIETLFQNENNIIIHDKINNILNVGDAICFYLNHNLRVGTIVKTSLYFVYVESFEDDIVNHYKVYLTGCVKVYK